MEKASYLTCLFMSRPLQFLTMNLKTTIVFSHITEQLCFQMKDETVNVEHRPLGRIGGALFCFSIFITSFYGAIFILGPCFALIYIWPWLYRRVVDRIVAFWLIFPIGKMQLFFYNFSNFSFA